MKPHLLGSVGEVVHGPRSQLAVAPSSSNGSNSVEGTVEKHDLHSASGLLQVLEGSVQQVDDIPRGGCRGWVGWVMRRQADGGEQRQVWFS